MTETKIRCTQITLYYNDSVDSQVMNKRLFTPFVYIRLSNLDNLILIYSSCKINRFPTDGSYLCLFGKVCSIGGFHVAFAGVKGRNQLKCMPFDPQLFIQRQAVTSSLAVRSIESSNP